MTVKKFAASDEMETFIDDTPEPTPEAAPVVEKDQVVQYMGGASIREITAIQWAEAGIEGMGDCRWTVENRHLLPRSEFTDAAIDVLNKDGMFRVVDADQVR